MMPYLIASAIGAGTGGGGGATEGCCNGNAAEVEVADAADAESAVTAFAAPAVV